MFSGNERGILFCGTGIGMMLAANKVKGAYASKSRDYDSGIFGFCLYMQRTFGKKSGTYLRIRETSFSLKTKTEKKTVMIYNCLYLCFEFSDHILIHTDKMADTSSHNEQMKDLM